MRSDLPPLTLRPPPRWLERLSGGPATDVVTWTKGTVTFLRASTAEGPRAWAFGKTGGRCVRIDPKTRRRQAEPRFDAMRDAHGEVRAFLERVAWLRGMPDVPSPGPAAEAVAQVEDALRRERSTDAILSARSALDADAGPLSAHRVASVRAAGHLLDLVAGDWVRVFPVTDAPDALPPWSRTVLTVMSGAVTRLRDHVATRTQPTAAGVLEGVALSSAGFEDVALGLLDSASDTAHGPLGATLGPDIARLARRVGREDTALRQLHRSILHGGHDDRLLQRCCFELVRLGAIEDAHRTLAARCRSEPVTEGIALAHAELLVWAGRIEEALPFIERVSSQPRGRRLDGVRYALAGDWERARTVFESVLEDLPDDRETRTWLAEVTLLLGDDRSHEEHLSIARAESQTPAHTLLSRATEAFEARPHQTGLVHLLEALDEPLGPWWEQGGPRQEAARVLRRFGGNRSERLTLVVPSAQGIGLLPFDIPPEDRVGVSRDRASDLLRRIRSRPRQRVEEDFEALAAEFPQSPHPLCYWGELDLWMGDYRRGMERFRRALERGSARWGYVGQAACHIMLGEWAQADRCLDLCAAEYTPVLGATTHVYLGEAFRRRGEMRAAKRELAEAVRVKRGRAGAWLNLALVHLALCDEEAADAAFTEVEERWPRLFWDGWIALGEAPTWPVPRDRRADVAESVLRMMRGNRSSHTITYFDHAGTFRIARDARALRQALGAHAHFLSLDLRARIVSGVLDAPSAEGE